MKQIITQIPELESAKHLKKTLSMSHSIIDSKPRTCKVKSHHMPLLSRNNSNSKLSVYDNEDQFEQIQKLKREINILRQENIQLRTHNQYFQVQNNNIQKEIDKIEELTQENDTQPIILKSSIKIKSLLKQIQSKEQEIENLKKVIKFDRMSQLSQENDRLIAVCELQKQQLLYADNSTQSNHKAEILNNLENDNIRLVQIIQDYEEQIKQLENSKRNSLAQQVRINSQKKLIEQLQNEIRQFKERDLLFSQKTNQKNKDQQKIAKQKEEINKMSQKIQDNEEELDKILRKNVQQIRKFEQQLMAKDEEIMNLKFKCESLQKALFDEYSKQAQLKKLKERQNTIQKPSTFSTQQINVRNSQDMLGLSTQRSISGIIKTPLQKQDLGQIKKILRFQMYNNRVCIQDIDKHIFKDLNANESTFQSLCEQLENSIFQLDKTQAKTLASYLFDQEDDTQMTESNSRIKSIFKALIDNFILPSEKQITEIVEEILELIVPQKRQIIEYLRIKYPNSPVCKMDDLFEALQINDVKLPKICSEYLQAYLYKVNNCNFDVFQIDQLDDLFSK